MPSFIETQFPVSRLSKESYKERKSNYSQTLTGLGKWWGRKPLILVRATILGLLLPATGDPARDRRIFLKLLTMDREGLLRRRSKPFTAKELAALATPDELAELGRAETAWRDSPDAGEKRRLREELAAAREELQREVFLRLPYEEQLKYCDRPEQIDGPSPAAWEEINAHLGTTATDLPSLVAELGEKRFGHVPRVGDAFCGGGSVPFEAARIGCQAYGSDLNPVAALLTWAALNIVGGGPEVAARVRRAQQEIYAAVDKQVTAWGIEHRNEENLAGWQEAVRQLEAGDLQPADLDRRFWRADAYLYCVEVTCPETGWRVPLAPSWVIGEKSMAIAVLIPDPETRTYRIEVRSGVSAAEMKAARLGTVRGGRIIHPVLEEMGREPATIEQVRRAGLGRDPDARATYHDSGLRLWENDDLVPRPTDVFGERLYCVRWVETYEKAGKRRTRKHYRGVTKHDLARERRTLELLRERFAEWQKEGFLPSMKIEPGYNTSQPIRERGWTHWHHLFNPRQLLVLGAWKLITRQNSSDALTRQIGSMSLFRASDFFSKLCRWHVRPHGDIIENTFANQALNTLFNYAANSIGGSPTTFQPELRTFETRAESRAEVSDARTIDNPCDFWLTDPPYADAINYHELSEYFLGWLSAEIQKDQGWQPASRRSLAVTGSDENFRRSMVDCYRNLANHMPDDGQQVVMFTHQDAAVWADLALILWASGLRVTAAWCIATETDSALKVGNYVQGTVLLVLRKQTGDEVAFLDEIHPQVEAEVVRQLESMAGMDEEHAAAPDFGDTDYQLAAYAAALRVLTQFRAIQDIDLERELARPRRRGDDKSELEKLIDQAVRIACDHLVPRGIARGVWRDLEPAERFYLKGLDLQAGGEFRAGAYQELARGFGLREYTPLLASSRANENRLKTATEFGRRELNQEGNPFSTSLTRHTLYAIREITAAARAGGEGLRAAPGLAYLRDALGIRFFPRRKTLIALLRYLATFEHRLPEAWSQDAPAAALLAGSLENVSA